MSPILGLHSTMLQHTFFVSSAHTLKNIGQNGASFATDSWLVGQLHPGLLGKSPPPLLRPLVSGQARDVPFLAFIALLLSCYHPFLLHLPD